MLELRRLQVLKALRTEGTMTAAAARLHMTTSAVSQQITQLEKEVGLPLLVRAGRNVRLNEAGNTLVEHYGHISAAVETAESSLKNFHTDVRGSVAVSAFPSFCSTVLPPVLMALQHTYPRLNTSVRDLEPFEAVAQLRSGHVDVAVVDDLHDVPGEGLVSTHLARDEIVLCLPGDRDHQVRSTVDLRDYAGERWILDEEGGVFERFVRNVCRQAGFEPEVVANCRNLMATLGLVRAGYGVSLMSELNLGRETDDLVVRRVQPACRRNILVLHRAAGRTSPAVRAVIQELQKATRARYDAPGVATPPER